MPARSKRNSPPNDAGKQANGLYVHSSPPRVLQVHSSVIRQWLRAGDVARLEQLVLQGQGHKLVGEYSPDPKVRSFLKQIPAYLVRTRKLDEAVWRGDLKMLRKLLEVKSQEPPWRNLHLSRNSAGLSLAHKAVYHGHATLVEFLASAYPQTLELKDNEGKTPLHYCGASKDAGKIWPLLVRAGADPKAADSRGRLPAYYMERSGEIQLPEERTTAGSSAAHPSDTGGIVIKPSNIRIWIHDRDLGKLQQVIWEGHGAKLRVETSKHPKVKRFLEGVPFMLNAIKDVHSSVVEGDAEEFRKKTADPVPVEILGSKDANGLNPLHKAAGLGRLEIAEEILRRNGDLVTSRDHAGRTPLHFAAALKDGAAFDLLTARRADEAALDKNGRAPSYYRNNPKELSSGLLEVVPEAPRTSLAFPQAWDWAAFHAQGDALPASTLASSVTSLPAAAAAPEEKTPEEEPAEGKDGLGETPTESAEANVNGKHSEPEEGSSAMESEDEPRGEERAEPQEPQEPQPPQEEPPGFDIWTNEDDGKDEQGEKESGRSDEEAEASGGQESPRDGGPEAAEEQREPPPVQKREMTEREIAEERQRLLDEGLLPPNPEEERQGGGDEVDAVIERGDMERLASLVLEGEGHRLRGKTSASPEIQNFLDNLPAYMAKIAAVHEAARTGSLRDLQAALDRRRFAVARESADGLGTTPLHEAVLFGNGQVVKYLGGRFPETLTLKDKHGRTPLHYAATLRDGGHLYGVLVDLGADASAADDAGRTPGHYLENPGELDRETLLAELGPPASDRGDQGVGTPVTDPSVHEAEEEPSFDEGIPLSKAAGHEEEDEGGDDRQSHFNPTDRDEYGQSVLHFAAARAHGRSGLFQLIRESGANLGYRDELYRTPRDIAVQANLPENVNEIDRYVVSLAAGGETGKLLELFLEGYDHILDVEDDEDDDVAAVAAKKNQDKTAALLKAIPAMEEKREKVQRAVRAGDRALLEELLSESKNGRLAVVAKGPTGRCALHVAVLCERRDVAELIAQKFPETLRIGDNLERTPLHYAMGVDDVENLSRTLIKCGAKRVVKDLKGRQPTYYFMNKSDVLKLQQEETALGR